ncbi:hypothetical protein [Methanobrevibacter sp.]
MARKKCVHITVDEEVWENAKQYLPNISKEVNEFLKDVTHLSDNEDEIIKEMEYHKTRYKLSKRNLCKFREQKALQAKDSSNMDNILKWAMTVYERRDVLGLNVLKKECKNRGVDFEEVKSILEREDIAFVNFDG